MADFEQNTTGREVTAGHGEGVSPEGSPLENIFRRMGIRMESTTLPERVVEAAERYLQPFGNLRIGEGASPAPLTPEQRGEFLREFMHGLLDTIGYPNAQVTYFQDNTNFFKEGMRVVSGYPGIAFMENFSFKDSEGNTYIVEVGFIPTRGFQANINYVPIKGTTTSTPFITTPSSPVASAPGSGV